MNRQATETLILAGAAIAGYILLKRALSSIPGAVADAATGAVLTTGDALGVPRVDDQRCAQAVQDGSLWRQSLYCTADEFTSRLFGGDSYDPNA